MIQALRISIGDITYENVKIAMSGEIEQLGLIPVLGEHTVMFKHDRKWHACHNWELKIIHLSRRKFSVPNAIPYERLVIASDKVYGPGLFATNEALKEAGIRDLWLGIERQVAFYSLEGTFVATDYSITSIVFPIQWQGTASNTASMASERPDIYNHIRQGGTRPCRSN